MGSPVRLLQAHTPAVSVRVQFEGGPADGTVTEYPSFSTALPSLLWCRDKPEAVAAIYHRAGDAPDPGTGCWRYTVART